MFQVRYRSPTADTETGTESETKEPGAEVTISKEEYEFLTTRIHESEELANKRVELGLAQVITLLCNMLWY